MAGTLQEGIYHAPGRRPGKFFTILFLRVPQGTSAATAFDALAALWSMYQDLGQGVIRDLPGTTVPAANDHLTTLLGFGPKAFDLPGIAATRPQGLRPANSFRAPEPAGGGPLLRGSGLQYAPEVHVNPASEEFCVQFIADTKLATDRAVVETWKLLEDLRDDAGSPPLLLSTFYMGFQRNDHRSWIDFHDGLSNLRSEDRADVITIDSEPVAPWVIGGTYLTFLRLAVDLPGWRRLAPVDQELAVGRTKISGCPLVDVTGGVPHADPGCPVPGTEIFQSANDARFAEPPPVDDPVLLRSHVQRANHHVEPALDPSSRRIFRQGYEFLEWNASAPGFRAGLNFVSFQDTPTRVLQMLTLRDWLGATNFGGDETAHPALTTLLTVYAAGVYLVPPITTGELFPGAQTLADLP